MNGLLFGGEDDSYPMAFAVIAIAVVVMLLGGCAGVGSGGGRGECGERMAEIPTK